MSEAERPDRRSADHAVTVEDVRQLMGASTPHFALQIRGRIARLVRGLAADDPARVLGEREIARLARLGESGETRGIPGQDGLHPLASVADTRGVTSSHGADAAAHPTAAGAERGMPGVGGA